MGYRIASSPEGAGVITTGHCRGAIWPGDAERMRSMRSNYINGTWTPSACDAGIEVVSPATQTVIDRVPAGHPGDVDAAVRAARAAFGAWSATSAAERAQRLDA